MLEIDYGVRFSKDVKRLVKLGKKLAKLWKVVDLLCKEEALPAKHRNHKLSGDWEDFWECHIEPDWLLIYTLTDQSVILVASGSHSDLF